MAGVRQGKMMIEGWDGDDYLILFDEAESEPTCATGTHST
jgi:hypothetical protein